MAEQENPSFAGDSLDLVEVVMVVEEALVNRPVVSGHRDQLIRDLKERIAPHLSPSQCDQLVREIEVRIAPADGGFGDDSEDGAITALVRKFGPRSPRGQGGAAAAPPQEPLVE